jgi:glycosyltransferase involved in cell wall biosynthesis
VAPVQFGHTPPQNDPSSRLTNCVHQHASGVLRVAIVCANASFLMGGEAAIPLRFFQHLRALGHQPTLLTHNRVRDELHSVLSPAELLDVTFFPDRLSQKLLFRLAGPLPSAIRESFIFPLINLVTEATQKRVLKARARAGEIDLVFIPTPISPKGISLINRVGVPTVFGPMNGDMSYPPGFRPRSGYAAEVLIRLGRTFSELAHHVFPAKRNAAALLVSNERTLAGLPKVTHDGTLLRSYDATIEAQRWSRVRHDPAQLPTHFLCVGRLVDWKAFEYAVLAAQRVPGAKLILVGDGPERSRLEALAAKGGADVQFMGLLKHEQLLEIYPRVIAQILPSLREAGGNVCLEALAAGVPVIATKWGGACDVVAHGLDGFLIEPTSEPDLIDGIAQAMRQLNASPTLARAMGTAGRTRVLQAFDWRVKAKDLATVFQGCLDGYPPGVGEAHPSHVSDTVGHINLAWRHSAMVVQPIPKKSSDPASTEHQPNVQLAHSSTHVVSSLV